MDLDLEILDLIYKPLPTMNREFEIAWTFKVMEVTDQIIVKVALDEGCVVVREN